MRIFLLCAVVVLAVTPAVGAAPSDHDPDEPHVYLRTVSVDSGRKRTYQRIPMYNRAEYTLRGVGDLSGNRRRTAMWRWISGSEWDGKPSRYELYVANIHGHFGRAVGMVAGMSPIPVWAPDGQRIAYGTWSENLAPFPNQCVERWTVKPDGTDSRHVANARGFWWGPDSRSYVLAEGCAPGEPFELALYGPDGERRVLAPGRAAGVVWTRSGRLLAYEAPAGNVIVARADSARVVGRIARATQPTWSPDGRRLAFIRPIGEGWFSGHLVVANADGKRVKRLVLAREGKNAPNRPTWSPDGRRIAYGRGQARVVEVIGADGRGRRVLVRGRSIGRLWWSRDGRKLYYTGIE